MPLGGCTLIDPVAELEKLNEIFNIFSIQHEVNSSSPLFQTPSLFFQFMKNLDGKLSIPHELLAYCNNSPLATQERIKFGDLKNKKIDYILIQVTTPYSLIYKEYEIDIVQFDSLLLSKLQEGGVPNHILQAYRKNLFSGDIEKIENSYKNLIEYLSLEKILLNSLEKSILKLARVKKLSNQEIIDSITQIAEYFGSRTLLFHHNFMYMPDGRAICWPGSFKADMEGIAREMDLRIYDFAEIVKKHGVKILDPNLKNWNTNGLKVASEFILECIRQN